MKVDQKLSSFEIVTMLILLMIGTGILSLPRFLLEASEVDTWLIILVGGAALAITGFLHGYIVSLFPDKGYFEILSLTLTKPIAYILCIIKVIYLITIVGISIRVFAEVLKGSLFLMTPIEVIMFTMILVGAYGGRQGVETLGRLSKILAIIMLPASIFVFFLGALGADFHNLLPVFEISFQDLVVSIPRISYSFIGFEAILIYGVFLNKPKDAKKVVPAAVLSVMFLYLFVNTVTIARFGVKQTMTLVWPTLSLVKAAEIPLGFVEDVTWLGMSLWVFAIFMSYLPNLVVNNVILGQMTDCRENNFYAIIQLPLIYFAAMIPNNVPHIYIILDQLTKYLAPIYLFIVPALILIIRGIKGIMAPADRPKS